MKAKIHDKQNSRSLNTERTGAADTFPDSQSSVGRPSPPTPAGLKGPFLCQPYATVSAPPHRPCSGQVEKARGKTLKVLKVAPCPQIPGVQGLRSSSGQPD